MKTSTKNSSTNCDSTRHVTDAQHDGVRTTVKKKYTQNSFKIHFQDAHGQSGWALELDLPQGPIKCKGMILGYYFQFQEIVKI